MNGQKTKIRNTARSRRIACGDLAEILASEAEASGDVSEVYVLSGVTYMQSRLYRKVHV